MCVKRRWKGWKCPSQCCQTTRTKKLWLPRISLFVLHTQTDTQNPPSSSSFQQQQQQQQHLVGVGKSNTKLWVTGWKTSQLNLQDPSLSQCKHFLYVLVCLSFFFFFFFLLFLLEAKLDRLQLLFGIFFLSSLWQQQQQQQDYAHTAITQTSGQQQQQQQHCNSIQQCPEKVIYYHSTRAATTTESCARASLHPCVTTEPKIYTPLSRAALRDRFSSSLHDVTSKKKKKKKKRKLLVQINGYCM